MSAGFDAAVIGFKALLSTKGESLTFGESDTAITGHVDRQPERQFRPGRPDQNSIEESVIEVLVDDMPAAPSDGDYFYDEFQHRHRVKTVKNCGYFYRCECSSTEVLPE